MEGEYLVWEGKEDFCGFRDFCGFCRIDLARKVNSLKSNYLTNFLQIKTTFRAKLSHSITQTLIALNKFVSSLCLSSDLSYGESTVAAPISFY